jgi:hypothetical protein
MYYCVKNRGTRVALLQIQGFEVYSMKKPGGRRKMFRIMTSCSWLNSTDRHRQADRQTDPWADGHMDRRTHQWMDGWTDGLMDRQTDEQTDILTDRQTD